MNLVEGIFTGVTFGILIAWFWAEIKLALDFKKKHQYLGKLLDKFQGEEEK